MEQILRKADVAKATGMGGLSVQMVKQFPCVAIKCLAVVFAAAIKQQSMPISWLFCKLTCIPKRLGKIQVKDLRPSTIAPVAYRLFCNSCWFPTLKHKSKFPVGRLEAFPKGPPSTPGFQLLLSVRALGSLRPVVQGVAIDTEKKFDNVPQEKALEALLALGFPANHVAAWAFWPSTPCQARFA